MSADVPAADDSGKPEDRPGLDATIAQAADELRERGVPEPDALLLLGTGKGLLPTRLDHDAGLSLGGVPGVPEPWRDTSLHAGQLNGVGVWILEDPSDEPGERGPSWVDAFPCWLAAAAGASTLVHTSAASALPTAPRAEPFAVGTLALASDHLNLSGTSPLIGLGESRLGPMFPDQSRLHDAALRRGALRCAERLGIAAREAVVACTAGPNLDTPAERRFYAAAGADVAVQGLATPLVAAAHAGLVALAIGIVTDAGEGPIDLARVSAAAQATAPALEDLLLAVAQDVEQSARAALEEGGR